MGWEIDWSTVRSWGGLLGLPISALTLLWSRYDRRQDRDAAMERRLTTRMSPGRTSMQLVIEFDPPSRAEPLQVVIKIVQPKTGTILVRRAPPADDPKVPPLGEVGRSVTKRLIHSPSSSPRGTTQVFLANKGGDGSLSKIDSGTVMIRVTTISSRRRLIEKMIPIEPSD